MPCAFTVQPKSIKLIEWLFKIWIVDIKKDGRDAALAQTFDHAASFKMYPRGQVIVACYTHDAAVTPFKCNYSPPAQRSP